MHEMEKNYDPSRIYSHAHATDWGKLIIESKMKNTRAAAQLKLNLISLGFPFNPAYAHMRTHAHPHTHAHSTYVLLRV